MKIGVALRLIPDLGEEIEFDDRHTSIDIGVPWHVRWNYRILPRSNDRDTTHE